jgi:hypothetical protein
MKVAMSTNSCLLTFWCTFCLLFIAEPFISSYAPLSFDGRWLWTNGLARAIATECGYSHGVEGKKDSMNFAFVLVHQMRDFHFAQTNSTSFWAYSSRQSDCWKAWRQPLYLEDNQSEEMKYVL